MSNYGQLREWAALLDHTDEESRRGYLLYGNEGFYTVNHIKAWILDPIYS